MRPWMRRGGLILLAGAVVLALWWRFSVGGVGGHDPNQGIDREKARAAANRVHTPPPPGTKRIPGAGG